MIRPPLFSLAMSNGNRCVLSTRTAANCATVALSFSLVFPAG